MLNKFHSNGKLLLTGEYLVLDGAKALAVPTKFGQSMEVSERNNQLISWKSFNKNQEIWFEDEFSFSEKGEFTSKKNDKIALGLKKIFQEAFILNPGFFSKEKGYEITSKLEFSLDWGLGSSSTLINNIAEWLKIDPYELLKKTFGGSGYDLACGKSNMPISYQLTSTNRIIQKEVFYPKFHDSVFFVHLNQKQNSRHAIAHYKKFKHKQLLDEVKYISQITNEIIDCNSLTSFEKLLEEHEKIISTVLEILPIKKRLFPDYPFAIKSLGGWGGDFVLVVGGKDEHNFFSEKGFQTIVPYCEMVRSKP